jgi:4-amino-4-deoxy-L-arabinose transferase-like glycosyltransferase
MPRDAVRRHVALQVLAAIALIILAQATIRFRTPQADAARYVLLARDLRFDHGGLYRTDPDVALHFPPGYPWVLSWVVGRDDLGHVPLLQRSAYAATVLIAAAAATSMLSPWVGWIVFALLAVNPALVASASMVASETPHAALYLAGFLTWRQFVLSRRTRWLVAAAVALALACYVRSYGLALAVVLPVFVLLVHRDAVPLRTSLARAAAVVGIFVLVLAPWTLINLQRFGHPIAPSLSGNTVYGSWFPGHGVIGTMGDDEVTREADAMVDPFARDAFYRKAMLTKIAADPGRALASIPRKYAYYLMPFDWEFFGRINAEGRLRPSFHFVYVFLVPFVLRAAWQARNSKEFWMGWMAPALFGLFMTGIVLGIPRFRLCAEPSLTIIGAASLSSWASVRLRARVPVIVAWFVATCAGALVFAWFVR